MACVDGLRYGSRFLSKIQQTRQIELERHLRGRLPLLVAEKAPSAILRSHRRKETATGKPNGHGNQTATDSASASATSSRRLALVNTLSLLRGLTPVLVVSRRFETSCFTRASRGIIAVTLPGEGEGFIVLGFWGGREPRGEFGKGNG
jgi:hypothetical protein